MSDQSQARQRIRWRLPIGLALASAALAAGMPAAALAVPHRSALATIASATPARHVTVLVQLRSGVDPATGRRLVAAAGGKVVDQLTIINALVAELPARRATALARHADVRAVSLNAPVKPQTRINFDSKKMTTSFNQSARSSNLWSEGVTGDGIGVAVIDTGIAGDQPGFRTSQTDATSRVVASVVTNPGATTASDLYGHGTHVAGIVAGNDGYRPSSDALFGKYAGAAPNANLISIKASDDDGNATVLDVIYGLQFAVDHQDDYNIRVVNLSLESSDPQSYKTDPLDAAAESAWFHGIVVVAAAGNRGTVAGAVTYAPGNDPFVVTVGAVDDQGTKNVKDDAVTSWSSRGTTQDGFAKPELYAPGAHIVSQLAPHSAFARMCPSCIRDGGYIQAGGTSMAAPIVSGIVAQILEDRPAWTPDQVKAALMYTKRPVAGGREVDAVSADDAWVSSLPNPNADLIPNRLVDAGTGAIDYTRSSWSRSSWSGAGGGLLAGWARSSWSCNCSVTPGGSVLPSRSSWSRSSWSTDWSK